MNETKQNTEFYEKVNYPKRTRYAASDYDHAHSDDFRWAIFRGENVPELVKCLFVGVGTGEELWNWLMIEAARNPDIHFELDCYDISQPSLDICTNFIETYRDKLPTNVKLMFVCEDFFGKSPHGNYDYVQCCGVVHHYSNYTDKIKHLSECLQPHGALVLGVYGKHGRRGVYEFQASLRKFVDLDNVSAGIRMFGCLPKSHALKQRAILADVGGSFHCIEEFRDRFMHPNDHAAMTLCEWIDICERDCNLHYSHLYSTIDRQHYDVDGWLYKNRGIIGDKTTKPLDNLSQKERDCLGETLHMEAGFHVMVFHRVRHNKSLVDGVFSGPSWATTLELQRHAWMTRQGTFLSSST